MTWLDGWKIKGVGVGIEMVRRLKKGVGILKGDHGAGGQRVAVVEEAVIELVDEASRADSERHNTDGCCPYIEHPPEIA